MSPRPTQKDAGRASAYAVASDRGTMMSFRRNSLAVAAVVAALTSSALLPQAASAKSGHHAHTDAALAGASSVPVVGSLVDPNDALAQQVQHGSDALHLLMSGTLLAPTGKAAAAGTSVRVDIEPASDYAAAQPSNVGVALVRLAETTTSGSGAFQLSAPAPSDLTGYVNNDGTVSLLITSAGSSGQLLRHVRAYPPTGDDPTWRWADRDDAIAPPGAAAGTAGQQQALTAGNDGGTGANLTGLVLKSTAISKTSALHLRQVAQAATAGVYGDDYCPGDTYYWTRSDANIIKTWDRIQRVYTMGKTTWKYDWSTTSSTSVDAAANLGRGGALLTAGYVGVQTSSSGVNFSFGHNANMDAAVQFDNRPYYLYCHSVVSGKTWYSGVYEWRPYKFTGGNTHLSPKYAIFACNATYKAPISYPLWVARSTSYTYQIGATLSVANLRVAQTNNSSHTLTFTPGTSGAKICGKGDYPVYATQVREVS